MQPMNQVRKFVTRALLAILNADCMNNTPCRYGLIGNIDAFDAEFLRSELRSRPELTVAQLISEAEKFNSCPIDTSGLMVIEGDTVRSANVWDIHEIGQIGKPK